LQRRPQPPMASLSRSEVRAAMSRALSCRLPGSATHAIFPFALFAAVQLADAILTAIGVQRFGLAVEANPLISFTMQTFGVTTALATWKLLACVGGAVLYLTGRHLELALLTVISVLAAAVPWAWILGI
jgi:di/tricarboxylate transporter